MSHAPKAGEPQVTRGVVATTNEPTTPQQFTSAETAEKMDDMDARVPMAENPVRIPERIAALIRARTAAKGRR